VLNQSDVSFMFFNAEQDGPSVLSDVNVNVARCTSDRADGPSSSALKNMKDTSDWFNPTNQRLLNTVSIMTTSSDYRTLNSSPHKPATWIVSSEKPLK